MTKAYKHTIINNKFFNILVDKIIKSHSKIKVINIIMQIKYYITSSQYFFSSKEESILALIKKYVFFKNHSTIKRDNKDNRLNDNPFKLLYSQYTKCLVYTYIIEQIFTMTLLILSRILLYLL